MFKLIISSDRAIQQAQNVIFESLFMALHGVTYVTFSFYPIKIDMTEQSNYFIIFSLPNYAFVCNYLNDIFWPF